METNKEKWQKKAKTIETEILRLQARLALIKNYIENEKFPKQNGKKGKTMAKESQKDDSGWL